MARHERSGKKKLFIPIFIITIMVLSVFGVMIGGLTQTQDAVKYNGLTFILKDGKYSFKSNGHNYNLLNSPLEVESFSEDLPDMFMSDFKSGVYERVYIDISDISAGDALSEIYTNLNGEINIGLSCMAGYKDAEQCLELPIKSCGEAGNLIVSMKVSEEKESSYSNGCIDLRGSLGYLIGVADVIVMDYAGVFDGK
ncbi:MAG: hypothetical protein Q8Q42_00365 [Nanoarchaeota archaeon]|nr:hypothetical protein [Nanoarchaeota archaeon]